MKWGILGADSQYPIFIFVIGDTGTSPEQEEMPILCTLENKLSFHVSQRFLDRLEPVTAGEEAQLTGGAKEAVILIPDNAAPGGSGATAGLPEFNEREYSRWRSYFPGIPLG